MVNARDAMDDGGRLTISTENTFLDEQFCEDFPDVGPGDYVAIRITDTGVGMDSATVDRVFEPFFSTKGHEGTGLGLAIVYGVVKRYDGTVDIKSQPNAGTTVAIYLPRSFETDEDADVSRPKFPLTGVETILLVEDEGAVRDLTAKILINRGYTVLVSENVEDAIRICDEYDKTIDLLLTDVVMPVLNGRELYLRVKEIRPDINVLYMSGYATDIIARHGVLEKETTFVAKPFSVDALLTKIREALGKSD